MVVVLILGSNACNSAASLPRSVADQIDLMFAQKSDDAVRYVAWVFGYSSSYTASYVIAARLIPTLYTKPSQLLAEFSRLRADYYNNRFRNDVVKLDQTTDEMQRLLRNATHERLMLLSISVATHKCGAANRDCVSREMSRSNKIRDKIVGDLLQDDNLQVREKIREAQAHVEVQAPGSVRFARPFIVRSSLVLIRITEFLSIILLTAVALRAVYLPVTTVTLLLAGSISVLAIDYGIHAADTYLNKHAYEQTIKDIVDQSRLRSVAVITKIITENETKLLRIAASEAQ